MFFVQQIEDMGWDSWSCVLGHTVSGVWPPKCDVTDVNAAAVTSDRRSVATADDFGMVKLFNYPASVSGHLFLNLNQHRNIIHTAVV